MGFAYSLCGLVSYIASNGIPSRPESVVTISLDVVESSVIHTNREQIINRAIKSEATHVLFLDHDMIFEPQIIDVLFSRRHPIVATNYLTKEAEPKFVAVSLTGERIPTLENSTGLAPIAYSGFGVSLFETRVFKDTPKPWFLPDYIAASDTYTTEDNPCFRRLREAGHEAWMDQDASKLITGHVGLKSWAWTQFKEQNHG